MFPNGWPGRGLLVLRLADGTFLLREGLMDFLHAPPHPLGIVSAVSALAGLFLLVGLWTPVAAVLAAAAEAALLLLGSGAPGHAVLLLAICVAIAMLGPGVWSIDAILFGRQRLDLP